MLVGPLKEALTKWFGNKEEPTYLLLISKDYNQFIDSIGVDEF